MLLAQVVQLNRRNPDDQHSSCPARHPRPDHCGAIFSFYFTQIQSKSTGEKEKHGKKHSFSDGKRFTDHFG
jgi:hypothetical protein